MSKAANRLKVVTARIFAADIVTLKRLADQRGSKWQIELRMLVRRALKGEAKDFFLVKE
jgi:hypothetical protein